MNPSLLATRVNGAADEIIARLATLLQVDAVTPLFTTCARGAIMTVENTELLKKTLPALRVWYGNGAYHMGANDFITRGEVGGKTGIHFKLDLDCYLYSFDKDETGQVLDLQKELNEIEWAVMDGLDDSTGTGKFSHSSYWAFVRGQIVPTSYGTVMQKFGGSQVLPPPWYTVTISPTIEVFP